LSKPNIRFEGQVKIKLSSGVIIEFRQVRRGVYVNGHLFVGSNIPTLIKKFTGAWKAQGVTWEIIDEAGDKDENGDDFLSSLL
jgi:hypothetical protein